ncbi:DUF721 domain-containing protein [Deinococcus sp.]|uniref:DUF721 domain-containing protein n=1 Tax=Deinococcus sp. TaxID=47478 RepID=UPI003CC64B2A
MSRRTGQAHDIRALLGHTLKSRGLRLGVSRARSIMLWPQVVGSELSRLTRARNQHGHTLYIEARDSAQAHHLSMQRHHFLAKLQQMMGDESVTELRFVVGTLPPEAHPVQPEALPAPDRIRARELVREVPADLKDVAQQAAEAITRARRWREQQGYRPCPVCGEASPAQPCRACTLTLEDPNVLRAAPKLARAPALLSSLPESLGDSGAAAARHLALNLLNEQMELLALECVRSGGAVYYRDYLSEQARLFLSLSFAKEHVRLTQATLRLLPERVRTVLRPED